VHQLALVSSLCRDRQGTLDLLRAAIDLGFSAGFAAQEVEFSWLAGDAEFAKVVKTSPPASR
jgi:hypothetical protein